MSHSYDKYLSAPVSWLSQDSLIIMISSAGLIPLIMWLRGQNVLHGVILAVILQAFCVAAINTGNYKSSSKGDGDGAGDVVYAILLGSAVGAVGGYMKYNDPMFILAGLPIGIASYALSMVSTRGLELVL